MPLEGFAWLIQDKLAGMAYPGTDPQTFAELRTAGIGAVVSLTMTPLPARLVEEQGFIYLHLPVPNFTPPLPSQIERFIEFCRRSEQQGRAVVVHCLAGCGRTGTMLACYLVWQGMEPGGAISLVRERRPCSIETPEQEQAVFQFAARLNAARSGGPDRGRR